MSAHTQFLVYINEHLQTFSHNPFKNNYIIISQTFFHQHHYPSVITEHIANLVQCIMHDSDTEFPVKSSVVSFKLKHPSSIICRYFRFLAIVVNRWTVLVVSYYIYILYLYSILYDLIMSFFSFLILVNARVCLAMLRFFFFSYTIQQAHAMPFTYISNRMVLMAYGESLKMNRCVIRTFDVGIYFLDHPYVFFLSFLFHDFLLLLRWYQTEKYCIVRNIDVSSYSYLCVMSRVHRLVKCNAFLWFAVVMDSRLLFKYCRKTNLHECFCAISRIINNEKKKNNYYLNLLAYRRVMEFFFSAN